MKYINLLRSEPKADNSQHLQMPCREANHVSRFFLVVVVVCESSYVCVIILLIFRLNIKCRNKIFNKRAVILHHLIIIVFAG